MQHLSGILKTSVLKTLETLYFQALLHWYFKWSLYFKGIEKQLIEIKPRGGCLNKFLAGLFLIPISDLLACYWPIRTLNCKWCLLERSIIKLTYSIELVLKPVNSKTANTEFTYIHIYFFDSFVFPFFNSKILFSIHLFCIQSFLFCNRFVFKCFVITPMFYFSNYSITIEKTYLLSCWRLLHQI